METVQTGRRVMPHLDNGAPINAMPDLLFLTQRLPYPPIKGEKIGPCRY